MVQHAAVSLPAVLVLRPLLLSFLSFALLLKFASGGFFFFLAYISLAFPTSSKPFSGELGGDWISLCNPGWPGTLDIDQVDLRPTAIYLPLPQECWD